MAKCSVIVIIDQSPCLCFKFNLCLWLSHLPPINSHAELAAQNDIHPANHWLILTQNVLYTYHRNMLVTMRVINDVGIAFINLDSRPRRGTGLRLGNMKQIKNSYLFRSIKYLPSYRCIHSCSVCKIGPTRLPKVRDCKYLKLAVSPTLAPIITKTTSGL